MAVFQDLQQIPALFGNQLGQAPVIQDQAHRSWPVGSVAWYRCHRLWRWEVPEAVLAGAGKGRCIAFPAGFLCQGTGDPGFAHTGRAGDQEIQMLFDPLAAGKIEDQGFIQSAWAGG